MPEAGRQDQLWADCGSGRVFPPAVRKGCNSLASPLSLTHHRRPLPTLSLHTPHRRPPSSFARADMLY